jgi:S-DNA-T family DNA segregation ATPase FtsK/SpoIIIE
VAAVRATVTLLEAGGRSRRVTVEWAGDATLEQLLRAGGIGPLGPAVAVDGFLHHPGATLDFVGLHDGSTVAVSAAMAGSPTSLAAIIREAHVAVVAGPGAGAVIPLRQGVLYLGSDPACEVVLADPAAAARHAALHVEPDGTVQLETFAPGTLDGAELGPGVVPVGPEQAIGLGAAVVAVRHGRPADAVVDRVGNEIELRRPPRLRRPRPSVVVDWPVEPEPPSRPPVPWAATLAPVAFGLVLYLATRTLLMLLFVGLTPITAIANVVSSNRGGTRAHRRAVAAYHEALARSETALAGALEEERRLRLDAAPDPASVLATATGPGRTLWERRRYEDDFLHLRLGLATLPSAVAVRPATSPHAPADAASDRQPEIAAVPAVVSLAEVGVLGVAGPPQMTGPLAGWLVAQAAVSSGPSDLQLVVLSDASPGSRDRWDWARWLPHTRPTLPGGPPLVATTVETVQARVAELVELIRTRSGGDSPARGGPVRSTDWPAVLVILDPAYDLRRVPGVDVILGHGPRVGVYAICVEVADTHLPVECRATILPAPDGTIALAVAERPVQEVIVADQPSPSWFVSLGTALAPLRDPESVSAAGTIPTSVRLVELLDLERLDAATVCEHWSRSRRSTAAIVGVSATGPFSLDLRSDGPHGLVAGTTGAGKSEFLQTLIASLAVVNRHDALNFLLVDYKGGSAFRDCARLPHTVGVVTDLDGHLTARALESLGAELRRRETLLAAGGAKDLDDYLLMGEPAGPLARLVIVIDEFAGLVAELPGFVSGLVGIAQRGRSLGVHLILATQRPSGVVSPEIRANTNLRVALRVTSPAESTDVIDAPDAARIMPTTPGRAFARTGHSALTPFQSARVGGPAEPAESDQGPEVAVADAGWAHAGDVPRLARAGQAGDVDPADTDLARLADLLTDAAQRSGTPLPQRPWLEPLPAELPVGALPTPAPAADGITPAPWALVDLPAEQRQEVAGYHPGTARHMAVAGGPGSGRTTLLRTLAVGLASRNSPDQVWLYAIDCGGGELRRLVSLPHTGAVVTRTELDRTSRLLARLHGEMHRRLDLLATQGFADLSEQRAGSAEADRLPYIVVLVDRWEGFLSAFDEVDNQRLTETVVDLAREGGSAGIRLVVTGDRSVLSGRLAGAIDERICLSLPDRNDYAFAGLDLRKVPDPLPPGRAVRSGDVAELHVAVVGADPSGPSQAAAVAAAVQAAQSAPPARRAPYRVDPLPASILEADAASLVAAPASPPERAAAAGEPGGGTAVGAARVSPHLALVGVGGDELHAVTVDLYRSGGFVVAGPRRSGRSNALAIVARSVLAAGSAVVAFCPRPSPLRALRSLPGVAGVIDGDDPSVGQALEVVNRVEGPLTVLVDDAPTLHGTSVAELLGHVATKGIEQGHVLVVAGAAEELMRPLRGFIYEVVQARTGMLLCPERTTDGDLLDTRLPRSSVFRQPAGRAVLVAGASPLLIQVPLAPE